MPANKPPDVKALVFEDAKHILLESGWNIAKLGVAQSPAGAGKEDGILRVARQRIIGEGQVALTLVRAYRGKG